MMKYLDEEYETDKNKLDFEDKEVQELTDWINIECGEDEKVSSERLARALIALGYSKNKLPNIKK